MKLYWCTGTTAENLIGRRKVLNGLEQSLPSASQKEGDPVKSATRIPCWIEDQQTVYVLSSSVAHPIRSPLVPYHSVILGRTSPPRQAPAKIVFPLSPDYLIPLLQYNVLRASLVNRRLFSGDKITQCTSESIRIPPLPSDPTSIPPSLYPTPLQQALPHEEWVDIIPHPGWRDNVLRAIGTFDEDELWSDIMGGLFEGFPASEIQFRGLIAWNPPWDISGWEISEGFWRKWGWSLRGLDDVLLATNRRRRERGEEPLVLEV